MTSAGTGGEGLPSPGLLRRLAISDTGVVLDPVSGQRVALSRAGLAALQRARDQVLLADLMAGLAPALEPAPERTGCDLYGLKELLG